MKFLLLLLLFGLHFIAFTPALSAKAYLFRYKDFCCCATNIHAIVHRWIGCHHFCVVHELWVFWTLLLLVLLLVFAKYSLVFAWTVMWRRERKKERKKMIWTISFCLNINELHDITLFRAISVCLTVVARSFANQKLCGANVNGRIIQWNVVSMQCLGAH